MALLGASVAFFKSRCSISLFKAIWKFVFTQKLKKLELKSEKKWSQKKIYILF